MTDGFSTRRENHVMTAQTAIATLPAGLARFTVESEPTAMDPIAVAARRLSGGNQRNESR